MEDPDGKFAGINANLRPIAGALAATVAADTPRLLARMRRW